ncbi:hypothetical protein [Neobacillus sp. LXY-4]|uniref:hypothetical protein n=1 Tax=Neobacillus sp. LXY-4 TaxID=3379826 RepID=UPI003EE359F2
MPRGKELEQLPMSHIAPGVGEDSMSKDREILSSVPIEERPMPSEIQNESKKKQERQ